MPLVRGRFARQARLATAVFRRFRIASFGGQACTAAISAALRCVAHAFRQRLAESNRVDNDGAEALGELHRHVALPELAQLLFARRRDRVQELDGDLPRALLRHARAVQLVRGAQRLPQLIFQRATASQRCQYAAGDEAST